MNTYQFFTENFGRYLVNCDGLSYSAAAWKALSSNHKLAKGTESRLSSGWAIIRPSQSSVQLKLSAAGLNFDERTRIEAFMDEFDHWDGSEPRIFLMFDKAPVPIANLFMSVDRRLVRICSPAGVESFDLDAEPGEEAGGIQKTVWKRKSK